jgi:hypothetical protein
MGTDRNLAFSSSDVTAIVGITPIYLNALVHRRLYGIAPSISDRHGEMKVRIFSEEDVFGIALVWMLFETGLRPQAIREILVQLPETEQLDANASAEYLRQSPGPAHLVIVREPGKKKRIPRISAEATLTEDLIGLIEDNLIAHPNADFLLVPIGERFAEIEHKIKRKYGE